jgi:hypothetical protein
MGKELPVSNGQEAGCDLELVWSFVAWQPFNATSDHYAALRL